jgi:hypothetical protein
MYRVSKLQKKLKFFLKKGATNKKLKTAKKVKFFLKKTRLLIRSYNARRDSLINTQ